MKKLAIGALVISAMLTCTNAVAQKVTSTFVCRDAIEAFKVAEYLANDDAMPSRVELQKVGCSGIKSTEIPFSSRMPHILALGPSGAFAAVQGTLNGKTVFSIIQIGE